MHASNSSMRQDYEQGNGGTENDESGSTRSDAVAGNSVPGSDGQQDTRRATSTTDTEMIGAPTMRSRVTVVCAECKKQKLKCDRRMPCESCTKRNTVSRCVYTPAAIEKVDMTSINNRLRAVEGNLTALGVTSAIYQPFQIPTHMQPNPLYAQNAIGMIQTLGRAGVPISVSSVHPFAINSSAQRQALYPEETSDNRTELSICPPRIFAITNDGRGASTVAPLDGVPALWIREISAETGHEVSLAMLQAEHESQGVSPSNSFRNGNMGSSKPLKLDLVPIDREKSSAAHTFGFGESQGFDTQQRLALHAGLGLPTSPSRTSGDANMAETEHASGISRESDDPIADMYESMAVHLVSKFPSQRMRRTMLSRLGAANMTEGMSCVPFHAFCAGVETICASTKGKEPAYHKSCLSSRSFSKIAEAAVGLAIGALIWAIEPSPSGRKNDEAIDGMGPRPFVPNVVTPAPSVFATDISYWFSDTILQPSSSTEVENDVEGSDEELEQPDATTAYALYRLGHLALSMHKARHGHAARDPSFIHTYTLSAHYLLLAESASEEIPDAIVPSELPPLVGALIWESRAMGLDVDPDEFDPLDEVQTPVGLGTMGPANGSEESVKREDETLSAESRRKGKKMGLFMKEVRRRLWWSVVWLDLLVSDTLGYNTTISSSEYSTRMPSNVDDSRFFPDSASLPPPDDSSPERNNTFYIVKLRLLQIGKHAPTRAFRSGLIPSEGDPDSVAAAAAQTLADEITQWMEDLPERFKLDANDGDNSPSPPPVTALPPLSQEVQLDQNPVHAMLVAQRCDLAFHAFHTIMRLFTPKTQLLGSQTPQQKGSTSWSEERKMAPSRQFAGLRAIEPALALINAAQKHVTFAPLAPRATYHSYIFARRLFDAAVVLAYAAIQQPLYTAPAVLEGVRIALAILSRVSARKATQNNAKPNERTEAEYIIETLLKRAERARIHGAPVMVGVKRKHEDLEADNKTNDGPVRFPFMSSGIMNAYMSPLEEVPVRNNIPEGEAFMTSPHPTGLENSESTSRPRNNILRSFEQSDVVLQGRQKNEPMASIRHRMTDRRKSLSTANDHRSATGSALHLPDACNVPSQPYSATDHFPKSGLYASSTQLGHASESASASPILPQSFHRGPYGMGPADLHFREPEFSENTARLQSSVPLQGTLNPSSVAYHYPVPSLTGLTFLGSVPPQERYGQSMARNVPTYTSQGARQHATVAYSSPMDRTSPTSDVPKVDRLGPSTPSFQSQGHELSLPGHHTEGYSPMPHLQSELQWNSGDENNSANAGTFTPSWNIPSQPYM